jgi:hypothetical protein
MLKAKKKMKITKKSQINSSLHGKLMTRIVRPSHLYRKQLYIYKKAKFLINSMLKVKIKKII